MDSIQKMGECFVQVKELYGFMVKSVIANVAFCGFSFGQKICTMKQKINKVKYEKYERKEKKKWTSVSISLT
jgi:hypothetical protein